MRDATKLGTYINLAFSTGKITGWINAAEKYKQGIYVDADTGLTT